MSSLPYQPGAMIRATVVLLTMALLSACSSTRMAYRYADWGVTWWVEDYVTLTGGQEQQLAQDLDNLRQWHCTAELPRYRQWLAELVRDTRSADLDREKVSYHQQRLFDFLPGLLEQAAPTATNLLASLSDEQVAELARNMARNHGEMEEKFLLDSPEARAEARAERTMERIGNWLGPLNPRQQRIAREWSESRGRQTEIWLEGRRNWQLALLAALEKRDSPEFGEQIRYLLVNSEEVRGDAYKEMMAESRVAMADLMYELIEAGAPSHLANLEDRAVELRGDFRALTCEPA
ncbi:DUF6279 family lipoprotein [Marinobacter pelagius]|uniref:DUF3549 domain-containing protein n=1 Tax=Marinobacter pelagius TaxID=379482 RepID=A0A1I5AH90_9GAMM|nr:DUF6279 family lipoprotein [Marinobacter pelagius]SFN61798.1 hypothetical protein SAMN04487961_3532 [Marinobacter pelagius]